MNVNKITLLLAMFMASSVNISNAETICDIGVASEERLKQLQESEDGTDKILIALEKLGLEDQKACHELLELNFTEVEKDPIADLLKSQ